MKYQTPAIIDQRKNLVESLLESSDSRAETIASAMIDRLPQRYYWLYECGQTYEGGIWADSITAASEVAVSNFCAENYDDPIETEWITVGAADAITGHRWSETMTLEPPEPECVEGEEHDWRTPFSVLGGCKENPGVWGHGGGVVSKSVCSHCGIYRVYDSWAQNPENGEQGLESTSYDPADEDSMAWIERRLLSAAEDVLNAHACVTDYKRDGLMITATVNDTSDDGLDLWRLELALSDKYIIVRDYDDDSNPRIITITVK